MKGCDLIPLVTSKVRDSEQIMHFQEHMQGSFQTAVTSRLFSQACLLTDQ